ncbi:MAG: anti-sigma factor domain-containing protein [Actinomycetota bacterium]
MNGPSTHDEIAELLGAYALNAVDPDEAQAVEAHLVDCPRCRAEVADHREVATLLGNSGGDAPAGLWERIAESLEEPAPPMRLDLPMGEAPASVVSLDVARRRTGRRWSQSAVALAGAAAAVVIAVLGVRVVDQQDRLDDLEAALADADLQRAAEAALADADAARATLRSDTGEVAVVAVLLPDGTGYLMTEDLPALPEDRIYQLWGQTEGGLISLGVFRADAGVVPFQATGSLELLAVTEESAGGVVSSENPPVVAGSPA